MAVQRLLSLTDVGSGGTCQVAAYYLALSIVLEGHRRRQVYMMIGWTRSTTSMPTVIGLSRN